MEIYAHRGVWTEKSDQNTLSSIQKAFDEGFGVETDIRYRNGRLVIGHDINSEFIDFEEVIDIWVLSGYLPLALNVKEDGLAPMLSSVLRGTKFNDARGCFLFDMSAPEEISYNKCNLTVAKRVSEHEPLSRFSESPPYIWLDSFKEIWWETMREAFTNSKSKIVVVSEELHGRDHLNLLEIGIVDFAYGICTDFPGEWKQH
jgi:glycerophosphoryl diester phosphodiesterase